jgi:hypothetical protein
MEYRQGLIAIYGSILRIGTENVIVDIPERLKNAFSVLLIDNY